MIRSHCRAFAARLRTPVTARKRCAGSVLLMAGIRQAHNGCAGRPPMCSPLRGSRQCTLFVLSSQYVLFGLWVRAPFRMLVVPFDSLGWPLLENTPNNNRRLLNVISMTATNLSTRLGGSGQPSVEPDALEAIGGLSVASPARPPQLAASVGAGKGVGIGKSRCCSIPKRSLIFCLVGCLVW